MATLSIVIPAYNEEDGIAEVIHRVLAVKENLVNVGVHNMELIVVDDGSEDKTAQITSGMDDVKLIRHPRNLGYGAALKTGFSQSKGELIGFLDADGTYPPEYFPQLCKEIIKGGELVIGSRMAGEGSDMPLVRRIGNRFFAGMISLLGRQRVTDSASGMRVFKREVLKKLYPLPDGLNLTPIMSTRAIHENIKLVEIPIPYSERVGPSKLNALRDGSVYLQTITWTVLTYNPVRVLGIIGMSCMAIAGAVGASIIVARLSGVTYLGHWGVAALFAGLLSGVIGISLISLGVTFNYLVSIFCKEPINQGFLGLSLFSNSFDRQFWWMGSLALVGGIGVAMVSLFLGVKGWEITRLWFYLLGSAMMILVGVQLVISWIILRVLDDLGQREILAERDMDCMYETFETEIALT